MKTIIWIIMFILPLYPVFPWEGTECTSGIYENDEFRLRCSFISEYLTLLFITTIRVNEEYDVVAGFSTPWLSYGPMYRYGLYKELFNPLAYTPGSIVFNEESKLRLHSGFGSGKKRFLTVSLVPGVCSLFFQTGEDIPLFNGGLFAFTLGDIFFHDLLISYSVPGAEENTDGWYTDSYQFPGGIVYHISIKSIAKMNHLHFSFTGSISGGDIIMPGFYINCFLSHQQDWYIISLLSGYCSEYFVTPGGAYRDRMIRTGSSFAFSPLPFLDFFLCYYLDIDHPSPFPRDYLCTVNSIKGNVTLTRTIRKEMNVKCTLSSDSSISFDEQGEKTADHKITFLAGLYKKHLSGESSLCLHLEKEKEIIPEWKIDLSFCKGTSTFSLYNTFFTGNHLSWKGGLDFKTDIHECEARLSFSCIKPVPLSDSGFQTVKENFFSFLLFSLEFRVRSEHCSTRLNPD